MATINTNIQNNLIDNKSFTLLRTNPKLTSNVKLLVSSNGDLFLSAFRANSELSKIEYQKTSINSSGKYSEDIAKFYKGLSSSEKYQTLRLFSDLIVYSDYEFQYEDQYQYGATHNTTKLYDEQYKIFAPIWLEKNTPSKFVIYRVEDVDYTSDYSDDAIGQNSRILELLKNATLIKTFDLGKSTKLGEYLSNHVNDKLFPNTAISVNFKEGAQSTFNGIDTINGGFASRAEQLDSYYLQTDYPEIFNNETITQGFERNGLAVANIINLEFLFDDNTADTYKIYRYFGIYVDDIEEGTFISDGVNSNGNVNIKLNTYQSVYDLMGTGLSQVDMIPVNSDFNNIPALRYVKDKLGNFYNLKGAIKEQYTKLILEEYNKLVIATNGADSSLFEGFAKVGKTITSDLKLPNYRGFIKFTIKDRPSINDRIFLLDKTEIEISEYNLGDYIVIADDSILPGRALNNKFSNQGSLEQIAIAISKAINNGEIVTYKTYVDGTSIIVEDYSAGNRRYQTALGVYDNLIDFIEINEGESNNIGLVDSLVPITTNTVFSDWDIYTMVGGAAENQSILVKAGEIGNVMVGEWVKQKDSNNFIQIIEIVKDPIESDYYRIILNASVKISNDGVFEIYDKYRVSHGRFSAYDFKDFDFDFYSTRNSNLGDLAYDIINPESFYSGLTGILGTESILNDTIQPSILNEYDRLNENQLKETSLRSRLVPTICKYELKDSSNARNLPYILNANEAFGEDNLSPNIEIDATRKVEYMNMEHFHINKIPKALRNEGIKYTFNNYIDFADDGGLTMDKLKDINFNYFESHFNWNGYYDNESSTWYDNTYTRLWTKFDTGNFEKNSSTVFRGLRYSYLKRKEKLKDIPTEFAYDSNISGYKFGVVFSYNNGFDVDNQPILKNSINMSSIKNDKFKFICIFIELNMIENDIDELDRSLLYSVNDIKKENQIVDTKIQFLIDFPKSEFSATDQDKPAILTAAFQSTIDGSAKFKEYVTENEFGVYSWIYFNALGDTYAVKVINIIDDSKVLVSGWPYLFINGEPINVRLSPAQFGVIPTDSTFSYFEGGRNGFNILLNEINAYRFANRFNKFGDISYINIDENGNITENDYVLSVESGVNVIKPSHVTYGNDPDRPKAYQLSTGEIGSNIIDRADGGYLTLLRRMNGGYSPLFNNIITFSDIYSFNRVNNMSSARDILIYNKFNGLGIAYESYKLNKSDYGYINNYYYHKANDEDSKNILKLSQSSDKLPLYPLISEIAIDKKNINLFKSKYSKDYFTKSLAAGKFETVIGTLSPVEKKNFMVSTIMNVNDTYDITRFNETQESSIESLDNVRLNKLNKTSIHWYEDDSQIIADFYLQSAILDELIEDGIKKYFGKYVVAANSYGDKSSINDDLNIYVKANIIPRFIIDSINVYGIEGKDLNTSFISVLKAEELTNNNFAKLTNFNIQGYQSDGLSFRLIYNKRYGYSYNFKIHVKIQA